jgi:membrane-bound metal-dependent hydrolase YbcI (DUF457 family)
MAAFREHITVSSALGVGYGFFLSRLGVGWVHCSLAAALCGIAGMLPDLDSDSGRPVRELFGVFAVVAALLLFRRMQDTGATPDGTILAAGAVYMLVRYGVAWLFKHVTVHRGMFHSLPAALIAAEIVFLAHTSPEPLGRLLLAGGVFVGFVSHLVLDEIYSVDMRGLRLRLKDSAGSALKLASPNWPSTAFTWLILAGLTYVIGVEQGYVRRIDPPVRFLRMTQSSAPAAR